MKLTAPMAMPTPNTMPASSRFDPPSPNANVTPPMTMDDQAQPTRDRAGEAGHEHVDRVLPRRATGLGVAGRRHEHEGGGGEREDSTPPRGPRRHVRESTNGDGWRHERSCVREEDAVMRCHPCASSAVSIRSA